LKGSASFGGGMLSGLNSALSTLGNISNTIQGIPVIGSIITGAISTVAGPIKDLASLGLGFNRLKENATIAFSVILKDGEKAKKLFDELAEFGRVSPIFKTADLIGGAQLFLQNIGPGPELFETLKGIGAITAATGHLENMERNFRTFKQVMDKPKLSAEEMTQQFPEAFVDAWGLLARARGQSVGDVQALVTKGMISGPGAAKVIIQQGLREYGAIVDAMGESDSGLDARLEDTLEQRAARATGAKGGLFDTLKGAKQRALTQLDGPKGEALADQIGKVSGEIGPAVLGGLDSLLDGSFLTKMQKVGADVKAGITEGFQGVKTGVGNAADYVLGFKTGIGANSPATEFIPLGQHAAEGFLLGFETYMIGAGGPMSLFQSKGGARLGTPQRQEQRRTENERLLQHPAIQAMMDAIGVGEGTFDPKTGQRNWMKWFGNARFTPGEDHPGVSPVPFFNKLTGKWDRSSAAGGGMFLSKTWRGAEDDVGDLAFNNPRDQEIAFVEKMRDRGMIGPLLRGDVRTAMALGAPEWASLPGSPYKQPTVKESTVVDTFNKQLGVYANGAPVTATNPMPVTMTGLTDKKLLDDFNATQLTATAVKNSDAVMQAGTAIANSNAVTLAGQAVKNSTDAMREGMIAAGRSKEEADKLIAATDKKTSVTETRAIPGLEKLGDTAALTAEQIAANQKLSDLEGGPAKKKKRDRLFDAALTKEGFAGDFQGGLQSALMDPFKKESWGNFGMGFLKDIQGRAAHDLSSSITQLLFGGRKDPNDPSSGLTGGLFGSLFGGFLGGSKKGWGDFKLPSIGGVDAGSGGGGFGGFFAKLLGSIFGGFRASGGDTLAGRFYVAGEHGPELIAGPGHVYNASQTRQMTSGGSSRQQFIFVDDERAAQEHFNASDRALMFRIRRNQRRMARINRYT
jgi:tape measure domain-containing protein